MGRTGRITGRGLVRGLVAALALAAATPAAAAENPAQVIAERTLSSGAIELTISTPALAAPAKVQVFLPKGYDAEPQRRWPVVFYLHGAMGNEARFRAFYRGQFEDVPAIWVAPAGGGFGFYSDWFNGGEGGPPMIETYQVEQLVPLIDARYRTAGTRAQRALVGESMGGYGVMSYATRHPDLFATAVSLSGALDNEFLLAQALVSLTPAADGGSVDAIYGPRSEQEVRWRGNNPTELAGNLRDVELQVRTGNALPDLAAEADNVQLAFDCVVETAIHQTTLNFRARLLDLGIPHAWREYPGCHTVPTFRKQFADALPGLRRALAEPRPDQRTFTYRSIRPRFSIWGWDVAADPARALEFLTVEQRADGELRLTGSGTTTVTSPPRFRRLRAVDVTAGGVTRTVAPDAGGRVTATVDLGPAHPHQQFTAAAREAGSGRPGYFATGGLRLVPHARIGLPAVDAGRRSVRVCLRALGGSVRRARIRVLDARGRAAVPSRVVRAGDARRCVRLRARRPLRPGRYTVRVAGRDAFGHQVATRGVRRVR